MMGCVMDRDCIELTAYEPEVSIDDLLSKWDAMFDEVAATHAYLTKIYKSLYSPGFSKRGKLSFSRWYPLDMVPLHALSRESKRKSRRLDWRRQHMKLKVGDTINLELGGLPDRKLNPNNRSPHVMGHARNVKRARKLMGKIIDEYRIIHGLIYEPPFETARIQITFHVNDKIRRDPANYVAALKPHIDELIGEFIVEDNYQRLTWDEVIYEDWHEEKNTIISITNTGGFNNG